MKFDSTQIAESALRPVTVDPTRTIVASVDPGLNESFQSGDAHIYLDVIESSGAGITLASQPVGFPAAESLKSGMLTSMNNSTHAEHAQLTRIDQVLQAVSNRLSDEYTPLEFLGILKGLTTREWDVMLGMLAGQSCKQISHDLEIGFQTVAKHKAHLFQKLHVKSVAELVTLLWSLVLLEGTRGGITAQQRFLVHATYGRSN